MPIVKTSKQELIVKAREVFEQRGYYYTSLADLADACGVQKAHFYYYFKDKEDILREVLLLIDRHFRETIFPIADDRNLPEAERLDKMLTKAERLFVRAGGCLMLDLLSETVKNSDEFTGLIGGFFDQLRRAFADLFRATYARAEADTLAERSVNDLAGALLFFRLSRNPAPLDRAIDRIRALI